MKLSESELEELAAQLRCPNGEDGVKVAEMMNFTNGNIIAKTISALNIQNGDRILEIGPGNGSHVQDIISGNEVAYHGTDISETMVAEAQKAYSGHGNVAFTLTDGELLPFESGSFNKIFTTNTIYFWNNGQAYANEIARVTERGGILSIGFIPKRIMQKIPFAKYGFTLYDEQAVTSLLEAAGFGIINEITEKEFVAGINGEQIEREVVITTAKKL